MPQRIGMVIGSLVLGLLLGMGLRLIAGPPSAGEANASKVEEKTPGPNGEAKVKPPSETKVSAKKPPEPEAKKVPVANTDPEVLQKAWFQDRPMPKPLAAWLFAKTQNELKPIGGKLAEDASAWALKPDGKNKPTGKGRRIEDGTRIVGSHAGTALAEAIRKAEAFTLEAEVQCADTEHKGPARIVSLSWDGNARNLTLGQEGREWVVRLRTAKTGANGTNPEVRVPGLDIKRHHILVVYSGEALRFYLDGRERRLEKQVNGSLANWDSKYPLVLGNEFKDPRDWCGWVRFVAFYDYAMTQQEARDAHGSRFPDGHGLGVLAPQEDKPAPAENNEDF